MRDCAWSVEHVCYLPENLSLEQEIKVPSFSCGTTRSRLHCLIFSLLRDVYQGDRTYWDASFIRRPRYVFTVLIDMLSTYNLSRSTVSNKELIQHRSLFIFLARCDHLRIWIHWRYDNLCNFYRLILYWLEPKWWWDWNWFTRVLCTNTIGRRSSGLSIFLTRFWTSEGKRISPTASQTREIIISEFSKNLCCFIDFTVHIIIFYHYFFFRGVLRAA